MEFRIVSPFEPAGDQPKAIETLVEGYASHGRQTLLGVTGSGKTFTMAHMIQKLQKPTLVLAHNKTLAAQLYNEFKEFFPDNKVCYFVSYYDYYQPESYLPQTDTYIDKETQINETIEQLRLEATAALTTRKDTIVVASVSCIYGLGSPTEFRKSIISIHKGMKINRNDFLHTLIELLYVRDDINLMAGRFRVRGDVVDIIQGFGGDVYRIEFFGDEIDKISILEPVSLNLIDDYDKINVFPAKPFVVSEDKKKSALSMIRKELDEWLPKLGPLEAHRLKQRTEYDLEMIEELGFCKGIENYSRYFDGRKAGEPPFCLLDFFRHNPFSDDYLMFIDESHVSVSQVGGMYGGDRSRKENLVEYGFRLPSAMDNRPLKFNEFENYLDHVVFVSATPGPYERETSTNIAEQIVRPTGLIDPEIFVRETKGQIDDLLTEIAAVTARGERVLVTTITKRLAEELTDYFVQHDVKTRYLHSEIDTLERTKILKDLRLGVFDVLVGINLLREGLDIPEVSLVAILDADKEGFLRNATSLVQTIGRAARNVNAKVVMYADRMTESMKLAIAETDRRRAIQKAYNEEHGIIPQTIKKAIKEDLVVDEDLLYVGPDVDRYLEQLHDEMTDAVARLDFEKAIQLRDKIAHLNERKDEEKKVKRTEKREKKKRGIHIRTEPD